MLKGTAVFSVCLVIVLMLIVLQPSPQESALTALSAAEKVLEQMKTSAQPAKLDEARQMLVRLKVPAKVQADLDRAIETIDEAKRTLASDEMLLNASAAQIKTTLAQVRGNLTSYTAAERARMVKDQLLSLVWPVVLVTVAFFLLNSKASLQMLTQLGNAISNIKVPGGLEIAFASTAVKNKQEEVLRGYREQVIATYDAVAEQNQIAETVNRIVKERIAPFLASRARNVDFRCTIHVRDILFRDTLYQLIDYVPRQSMGGRGRAWSVRFGMMGRVWRLEETAYLGQVPTNVTQLVNDWGMTRAEAEAASGRQTLFCYLIKAKNKSSLAIFYLDAAPVDAFGSAAEIRELEQVVKRSGEEYGLDSALERVWDKVQASAPLIEIYAARK